MRQQTYDLITRMISAGYSDEDIVLRLRHPIELVQAIRKEIENHINELHRS